MQRHKKNKFIQSIEAMSLFEPIFEFSRHNCVAICSFLVPANLITTIFTLILVATKGSVSKMRWSRAIASVFAATLFLHVSTWFIVGVITPVTFILFGLGATCLVVNTLAVVYRREIVELLSTKLLPAIDPNLID